MRTGDTMQVSASAPGEGMTLERQLGGMNFLLINDGECDGATIFNVNEIRFSAGAQSQTVTLDYSSGGFLSDGQNERGYFVDGFGDTTVATDGSVTSGTSVVAGTDADGLGTDGLDISLSPGTADVFLEGIGFLNARGSNLSEQMTTAGGAGVGGPYTGAALLQGSGGQDQLTGGASATTLEGGADDDTLVANAGADASGGPDDDLLTGGDGANTLDGRRRARPARRPGRERRAGGRQRHRHAAGRHGRRRDRRRRRRRHRELGGRRGPGDGEPRLGRRDGGRGRQR